MNTLVPEKKENETELQYLKRKEISWGYWQADALEALSENEKLIQLLKHRVQDLEKRIEKSKELIDEFNIQMTNDLMDIINTKS